MGDSNKDAKWWIWPTPYRIDVAYMAFVPDEPQKVEWAAKSHKNESIEDFKERIKTNYEYETDNGGCTHEWRLQEEKRKVFMMSSYVVRGNKFWFLYDVQDPDFFFIAKGKDDMSYAKLQNLFCDKAGINRWCCYMYNREPYSCLIGVSDQSAKIIDKCRNGFTGEIYLSTAPNQESSTEESSDDREEAVVEVEPWDANKHPGIAPGRWIAVWGTAPNRAWSFGNTSAEVIEDFKTTQGASRPELRDKKLVFKKVKEYLVHCRPGDNFDASDNEWYWYFEDKEHNKEWSNWEFDYVKKRFLEHNSQYTEENTVFYKVREKLHDITLIFEYDQAGDGKDTVIYVDQCRNASYTSQTICISTAKRKLLEKYTNLENGVKDITVKNRLEETKFEPKTVTLMVEFDSFDETGSGYNAKMYDTEYPERSLVVPANAITKSSFEREYGHLYGYGTKYEITYPADDASIPTFNLVVTSDEGAIGHSDLVYYFHIGIKEAPKCDVVKTDRTDWQKRHSENWDTLHKLCAFNVIDETTTEIVDGELVLKKTEHPLAELIIIDDPEVEEESDALTPADVYDKQVFSKHADWPGFSEESKEAPAEYFYYMDVDVTDNTAKDDINRRFGRDNVFYVPARNGRGMRISVNKKQALCLHYTLLRELYPECIFINSGGRECYEEAKTEETQEDSDTFDLISSMEDYFKK